MNIAKAASLLLEAEASRVQIPPFTSSEEPISAENAYRIQLEVIRRKVDRGSAVIGKKIGLTSKAMQDMLQVNEPDFGFILNDMVYRNGGTVPLERFIQPRVEFEIAFMLKKDLKGPGVTMEDVLEATHYVVPAIEIIDSRIKDWKIKYADTVADNGSSAAAIFGGKPADPREIDLPLVGMAAYKNGSFLDSAAGAAVMGHPARAVAWLANAVGQYGITLHAGEVIMAGALSRAVPIEDGDTFTAEFAGLGSVSATFRKRGPEHGEV